eukprot:TRINITY_DN15468_c0_g1_i1.p1 TRINITY_DN15468_c0_g1~~TRINITY_DN15468_c0_g1_i1.p1  ORF type:complete len:179 (-),score=10.71 TRINITY_DN15468_c0_g1_i1:582-1073(-)
MKAPSFNPPITYIVAQKRNNVRFLPHPRGRQDNIQPGTIVDKGIGHPFFFDFYLCAHKGIIGTSRPVHFHVLHDENNFTADDIQHLTHSLCYCYGRCTRAVSTVAPVFYAHLAATHCRNYFGADVADWTSESSGGNRDRTEPPPTVPPLPKVAKSMNTSMFFC